MKKKSQFFVIAFLFCQILKAQTVFIPDSNLVYELNNIYFNLIPNGYIDTTDSRLSSVTSLTLHSSIRNTYGLQFLKKCKTLSISTSRLEYIPPRLTQLTVKGDSMIKFITQFPKTLKILKMSMKLGSGGPYPKAKLPTIFPDSLQELNIGASYKLYSSFPDISNLKRLKKISVEDPMTTSFFTQLNDSIQEITLSALVNWGNESIPNGVKWPKQLKKLDLSSAINNSQITNLPRGIQTLICATNISLDSFPSTLKTINVSIGMNCIPKIPMNATNVSINSQFSSCIPNQNSLNNVIQNGSIGKVCPVFNPDGCKRALISGYAFYDVNNNNFKDAGDKNFPNAYIKNSTFKYGTLTDKWGYYSIAIDTLAPFTFNVSHFDHRYFYSNDSVFAQSISSISNRFTKNLVFKKRITALDLGIYASNSQFRPGFRANIAINITNLATVKASSTAKILIDTSKVLYLGASKNIVNKSGNVLSFSITDLDPIQDTILFLYFNIKQTVPINSTIQTLCKLTTTTGIDVDTSSNTYLLNSFVTGSFDPNEKLCENGLSQLKSAINKDNPLVYKIDFENIGNDTAFNIIVFDTLNTLFNPGSLQFLSSSHTCSFSFEKNILAIHFQNILLPDSGKSKEKCKGWVRFSILPSAQIKNGDILKNRAAIYFDFNNPVITKTSELLITTILELAESEIKERFNVFPNPASNFLNIYTGTEVIEYCEIYSITGKLISKPIPANNILDIQELHSGMFQLSLVTKTGKLFRKLFIKIN